MSEKIEGTISEYLKNAKTADPFASIVRYGENRASVKSTAGFVWIEENGDYLFISEY